MKRRIVENVRIIDTADKGYCIGKDAEGHVYMVEDTVPGDVADITVFKKRKGMMYGSPSRMHTYSPYRSQPFCEHFSVCGGCKWQHMSYEGQLTFKAKTVENALSRLAKVQPQEMRSILGSPDQVFYRNKMEYAFSSKRWLTRDELEQDTPVDVREGLGLHRPGAFDKVVDINFCHLQDDYSNTIRNGVREFALNHGYSFFDPRSQKGLLRNLMIRNTTLDQWMVVVVFAHQDDEKIKKMMTWLETSFDKLTSIQYIVNTKKNDSIFDQEVVRFSGQDHIVEQLGSVKYRISAKSFFQTNSVQAKRLYDIVSELAGLSGSENVYDLYTGTGSIALYLAQTARKVIGIEEVEAAVEDARMNMAMNDIENTVFYVGDVKDILTMDFAEEHGKPDVVVTDPPRAGMHEKVVEVLRALKAPTVVYVSCNPATQARDLGLLKDLYDVAIVQPVDMFPHTHHIESVVKLVLK